ncbi:acetyltransferase, GNAT family [Roseibacterium elongatum DSM 19469]|uniref:Acetyltransferase, GNAT family n=1 Tax=Roseicyclus elongatus DSM 19469 TaxID=1294273 RepID=W8RRF8_9RHOB|nr:N-acetyltransferase [Roseibacterium elongatum]AHM03668.1 acetyltransferase, GNAT family [Roseibacterium elongatum DSM 19469]
MPDPITIRTAQKDDLSHLDGALRTLAEDLGDPYPTDIATLERAAFGACPSIRAQLALAVAGPCVGIALASPLFSTMKGGTGVFVSDLWVSSGARGRGLGPRLLSAALRDATRSWGRPLFLRLMVHDSNADARRFYGRMGFDAFRGMDLVTLEGEALTNLEDLP